MSTTTPAHDHRVGYLSVPKNSLAAQISLLLLVLDGMKKHAKDPDYPTQLDTLGVAAAHDAAASALLDAKAAKAMARHATAKAVGERTQIGVFLEKIQAILVAAYGKKGEVLWDYGFRVPRPRPHRAKAGTASTRRKKSGGTAATGSSDTGAPGSTAPSGSPGTTPAPALSAPSAAPPSTTPRP